jgi:AbiV family abortive infection protein
MLTATSIIEGAYYATDQAGQLLHDAVVLYDRRRWAVSLVLASLSLEELGKAKAFLSLARDAVNTGPKSVREVRASTKDHLAKLRAGRSALTITPTVIFWGEPPEPGTREMEEIERRLADEELRAQENAPKETHGARMRALYVDLRDDGVWQRPTETTPREAYEIVSAVSVEYGEFRGELVAAVRQTPIDLNRLANLPEAPRVHYPRD